MDKLKTDFDSMIVNCPCVDKLKIEFDSMIVNLSTCEEAFINKCILRLSGYGSQ